MLDREHAVIGDDGAARDLDKNECGEGSREWRREEAQQQRQRAREGAAGCE